MSSGAQGWTTRAFDAGPFEIVLEAPASPDALVREEARAGDAERGYWAHLWSSAEVLARHIAASSVFGPGVRVLEVGCGLGLPGLAAAKRGCSVVLTDREDAAVDAVQRNAELNGLSRLVLAARYDWRDEPDPAWAPGVLLAADVLYKREMTEPLGRLIQRLGCLALICEPNRTQSAEAPERLRAMGLRVWPAIVRGGRILTVQGPS